MKIAIEINANCPHCGADDFRRYPYVLTALECRQCHRAFCLEVRRGDEAYAIDRLTPKDDAK